jgi:hypothetical protein
MAVKVAKKKVNLAVLDAKPVVPPQIPEAPAVPVDDRPIVHICFQITRYGDQQENVLVGVVDDTKEQKERAERWKKNDPRRQVIPWRIGKLGIEGPGV